MIRGLAQAVRATPQALLVVIDTPGGLLKSMDDITKAMLNSPMPVVVYVYPKGARAASAGVFVVYAANIAAMAPATHLGAAHPVGLGTGGGADKTEMTKVTDARSRTFGASPRTAAKRGVGGARRTAERIHHR